MKNLRCTTVQLDIAWHQPEANRKKISELLSKHNQASDVIILPEMYTTGFSMEPVALAESMTGDTMRWMAELADQHQAAICGSIIIKESEQYYNRLIWMYPGGMYHTYDKRHLFKMAGEHEVYTAGEERLVVNYEGWRICPMICYDLRFPVWSRSDDDYDILIYVANWPEKRAHHWRTLLKARAIENQAYAIGVNRYGKDGNDHNYVGDTCIASPQTDDFLYHHADSEQVNTYVLSHEDLSTTKSNLPFLIDRDTFKIL